MLTDTAGFACACWRRGIPWCRLPTTLLGIGVHAHTHAPSAVGCASAQPKLPSSGLHESFGDAQLGCVRTVAVDASVGIKVAINYHRKNGVGHFFSPLHTFIDTSFLSTVSLPDIRSGVGEIMKAVRFAVAFTPRSESLRCALSLASQCECVAVALVVSSSRGRH